MAPEPMKSRLGVSRRNRARLLSACSLVALLAIMASAGFMVGALLYPGANALDVRPEADVLQCANPDFIIDRTDAIDPIAHINGSQSNTTALLTRDAVLRDRTTGLPIEVASMDRCTTD